MDEIKNTLKANSVRLGISPSWLNYNTADYGYRLDYYIDTAINRAIERGLYVLLDFHAVDSSVYPYNKGGFTYGKKYHDTKTTYELMLEFWQRYASKYNRYPYTKYVIFELWNEEVRDAEVLDHWLDYKAKMEYVISQIIRPVAPNNLLIVNGLNNGLNLRRVVENTDYKINDPQNLLIYGWHPYPNSVKPTYSEREALTDYLATATQSWDYNLRGPKSLNKPFITELYPVVITEFGWRDPNVRTDLTTTQKNEYGGRYVRSDGSFDYGKSILTYAYGKDIKGYFPFRFYYEKIAIVGQMPDWWNPTRTYSYTPDYGTIIRQWFSSRSIP
jgi:aryl-phospho-beta-D-glucosidase BglC (GH1 family)